MPKVVTAIGEQEAGEAFEARIALAANQLVGNYNSSEHCTSSKELQYGRLNCVFKLDGMNYQSRPEAIARAMKSVRLWLQWWSLRRRKRQTRERIGRRLRLPRETRPPSKKQF
jgi:hypothetical protein